ncbi:UDP-glucuronosyltransferase 2B7-like isoform X2 [Anoplophora glabripennis]|uniref:UDP-glucuronosyltransferase 2B7-like isoform X2 n=1 Tax=Anoplophora glabripennis TaxID=217634 RepID=UPI0008745EC5|nr:UDP-glucuronosyltransferase 2B7-like isoform X2 [Anoplophora glabripennis]
MFCKYVCLVLLSVPVSYCANILAIVPTATYSHHIAYAPLWKALSLRGHNVTLVTTHPMDNHQLTNLTELNINWASQLIPNVSNSAEFKVTMWNFHSLLNTATNLICDRLLYSDIGQKLLDKSSHFDLVLVENVCPELLGFAEIILGDFAHPISHPEFVLAFQGQLNFRERVISTMVTWYLYYTFLYVIFPKKQKTLQKYFNNTSTIPELIRDTDMLFLNVNPNIHGPRAIGPATITVGGNREDLSPEPIPKDIKKFLDDAKDGCILVSLGSTIKSSLIDKVLLKSIIDTLREVPYKVLWKFETKITNIPKNVKTAKWLPQQKILNHPNLKLFVSQGGLQSVEEGIYGEVPFVIIPFIADQFQNARMLENKGVAIVLDKNNLNKHVLKSAILKVMNDPKYTERVKKVKQLILDEPMSGLEKAVWWTEYVIRNKGAKHLRNPAADIPLYQYFLLDVIGFFLLIVILIVTALLLALKKIYKLFWRFRHEKLKSQ